MCIFFSIQGFIGKIKFNIQSYHKCHFYSGTVNEDIIVSLSDSDQSNSILQVEVRNGSAILVLAGQLDREGVSGPSKVVTSVQCARSRVSNKIFNHWDQLYRGTKLEPVNWDVVYPFP